MRIGQSIAHYRITAKLGQGGMGEVYRATDTRLDRDVAIKLLPEALAESGQLRARFEREARAVAALNHSNICTLYDVGPNYLVMECIEGTPLEGPLPLDQTVRYAAQICDALDAAHRKGITHRDLKPANILVTKTGVKLLDFGLAKTSPPTRTADDATLAAALTGKNEIVGTLYYMSPEQLQGEGAGHEIDARSDIFSFGLVLYEMLTGKRAFGGSSPASVIAAILERPAPSIAEVAPPALDFLLQRCLEKDPDERWQSARDLKLELEWIASASTNPVGPTAPRRFRALPWLAAGLLAVVAAGTSWVAWHPVRPLEKPLMRFSVDLGPDALTGGDTTVVISPDATRVVFPVRGADGRQQLATRPLDQPTALVLPGTQGGANPFFSPDNQWIGFFADGKLKKTPALGGAAVTLCDAPFWDGGGGAWSEDGAIVARIDTSGVLFQVPAAGGIPQPVTKLDQGETSHVWPQFLPGGKSVLYTASYREVAYEEASIKVVSVDTGKTKNLLQGGYFGRYIPSTGNDGYLVYMHEGVLFGALFDPAGLELRGEPVRLLENVASNPGAGSGQFGFSDSGTFVFQPVGASDRTWPVVWLASAGNTQPLLARTGVYDTPRLSPSGERLAVAFGGPREAGLQVYDWPRNTLSQLTTSRKTTGAFVWTPDGRHLVFSSDREIWWVRADGAGKPQRLSEPAIPATLPALYSFSPDGKRVAYFDRTPETGYDLWTLPFDMSDPEHPKLGKPEPFLRTTSNELEPVFSPDGRWVAYRSDETGRWELYVRPFPGPGGRLQISLEGAMHPRWSPNGSQLFYETLDNHIMVVAYTAKGGSFISGKPHLWSPVRIRAPSGAYNFDVAADGKRLAVFPLSESVKANGSVHATFLLNFPDELRRKMPHSGN